MRNLLSSSYYINALDAFTVAFTNLLPLLPNILGAVIFALCIFLLLRPPNIPNLSSEYISRITLFNKIQLTETYVSGLCANAGYATSKRRPPFLGCMYAIVVFSMVYVYGFMLRLDAAGMLFVEGAWCVLYLFYVLYLF